MANNPEIPSLPLSELFAQGHEAIFPDEMPLEQRKRIRQLLWDSAGQLYADRNELERQVAALKEEKRRLQEGREEVIAALQNELQQGREEMAAMVAEKEALAAEIRELHLDTYNDNLTGLLNSTGFEKGYVEWLQSNEDDPDKKFVVLYIDVNDLKKINDTYSHSAGDAAIKHFADALRHVTRDGDVVARMHGDEFVLGLPGARSKDRQFDMEAEDQTTFDVEEYVHNLPARISERLQTSINDDNVPEGTIKSLIEALQQIKFSYGANIVTGDDFKKPITALLHTADERMYIHKHQSKAQTGDVIEYSI